MSPNERQLTLASEQLISLSEAARLTPYSAEYLGLRARTGKLKAVKIGRDWMTTGQIVSDYVKEQELRHSRLFQRFQNATVSREAGFAGLKMLIFLGAAIFATTGFLIAIQAGIVPNTKFTVNLPLPGQHNGVVARSAEGEAISSQERLPRPSFDSGLAMTESTQGQVLGLSTSSDLTSQIQNVLNQYIAEGKFQGSKGDPGTSSSPELTGGTSYAPITYYPVNSGTNFGGSVLGATDISSQNSVTNNQTVTNNLTVQGNTTFNSSVTFATSTNITVNNLTSSGTSTLSDILPQTAGSLTSGIVKQTLGAGANGMGMVIGPDGFARIAAIFATSTYPLDFIRCTDADCSAPVTTEVATSTYGYEPGSYILTLGADHLPRITYQDVTGALQFVRCEDRDCTATVITPVDTNVDNEPGDYGQTVILGDDNLPRVAYADCGNDYDVHFVRFSGEDTIATNTDLTNLGVDIGCSPYDEAASMAIGPDHFARIAYMDGNDGELKMVRCTDEDCTTPVIDIIDSEHAAADPGYYGTVIRMGSDGFPRIAYTDYYGQVYYAVCSDIDCSSSSISTLPIMDVNNSYLSNGFGMDLRAGDLASIVYHDTSDHVHILNCTNATCSANNDVDIDSSLLYGIYGGASLVIGPDNLPRVAYSDYYTAFKFARLGTLDGNQVVLGSSLGTNSSPFGQIYSARLNVQELNAASGTNGSLTLQGYNSGNIILNSTGGYVGIGTTTPGSALTVQGDINLTGDIYQNGVLFSGGDGGQWTTSGNNIYNGNSGNVGIGTTNPQYALDVSGGLAGIRYLRAGGGSGYIEVDSALGAKETISIGVDTTGGQNGFGSPSNFIYAGQSGGGNARNLVITNADTGKDIIFVTNGYNAINEKMRITSVGNVGIGTTNPTYPLDIKTNANGGGFQVEGTGGNLGFSQGGVQSALLVTDSTVPFRIGTGGGATIAGAEVDFQTTGATAMSIINGGNVGIGTTDPQAKLDVKGSAVFSGPTNASPVDGEFVYDTDAHMYKYYNSASSSWFSLGGGDISYTGTLWTQNGSNLSYTGGNVAIGTTSAVSQLTVQGTSYFNGNVGIGTTNPQNSLDVNGGVAIGSYAGSNPAGSGNLVVSGNVGIGTASPTVPFDVEVSSSTINNVTGSLLKLNIGEPGTYSYASYVNQELGGSLPSGTHTQSAAYTSSLADPLISGTTGTYIGYTVSPSNSISTNFTGFNSVSNYFYNTATNRHGFSDSINDNTGGKVTNNYAFSANYTLSDAGSQITNNYGLYLSNTVSAGSIANSYGVYLNPMLGSTISYGIYQAGAADQNYFAGNVGIGTTTPIGRLSVVGNGTTTGTSLVVADSSGIPRFTVADSGLTTVTNSRGGGQITLDGNADNPVINFLWNGSARDSITGGLSGGADLLIQTLIANGNITLSPNGTGNTIINSNVGIGTTTPATALQVLNTSTQLRLSYDATHYGELFGDSSGNLKLNSSNGTIYSISNQFQQYNGGTLTNVLNYNGNSYINGGNVGIGTTTPGHLLTLSGGAYSDGLTWEVASDMSLKENFASVTPTDILQKIDQLPISQWNYKSQSATTTHIGPMAQDFYKLFGLGGSNTSISALDPAGVALLGIQALDQKITALQGSLMNQATTSNLTVYNPNNFSGDSVGEAKILAGSTSVRVTFSQAYEYQPIVTVTPLDFVTGAYRVTNIDAGGFSIELSLTQTGDVTFDYHSFASPQEQLTVSDGSKLDIQLVVVSPVTASAPIVAGGRISDVPDSDTTPSSTPPSGGSVLGDSTSTPDGNTVDVPDSSSSTPLAGPAPVETFPEPIIAPPPIADPAPTVNPPAEQSVTDQTSNPPADNAPAAP